MEYSEKFINWGYDNQIGIAKNTEVFFINERLSYKPEYIINNKIFVDVVPDALLTDAYIANCVNFSKSFAQVIVIPVSIINDLDKITIDDIKSKFNINF